jgi:homoserine dehydrogenase
MITGGSVGRAGGYPRGLMRILLLGFGTVGRGLAELLSEGGEGLRAREGLDVAVVGVVDSKTAVVGREGLDPPALLAAKQSRGGLATLGGAVPAPADLAGLIASAEADCVVQAVPSDLRSPLGAVGQLKAAFASGKHAVTVTKAPLGVAMGELVGLALRAGVEFRYSGTVGASTPFLDMAGSLAKADRLVRVEGIFNGTTNFILSAMHESGASYEAALEEATRLGYAETDPSNDVDGIDTAVKLVILANHARVGRGRTFADVRVEGIRGVTGRGVAEAKGIGKVIRLIGRIDEGELRVGPEEVDAGGPLDLPGATNAAVFTTETCGAVVVRGSGAGGRHTASAILRDLVDIWRATR